MSVKNRVLDALTVMAFASTIVIAGVVVHREYASRDVGAQPSSAPKPVKNWNQYIFTGRLIGPSDAALKIVEFADFQCPGCRALNPTLQKLRSEYPRDFAISYHYAPLPYHAYAYPAARAAECAAEQASFVAYHDALFASFDSIGVISFTELARRAHVPNLAKFAACASRKEPVRRIDADKSLAFDTLNISGTPTVLVNGQMYAFAPRIAELRQMIERARSSVGARRGS